jgi:hypothetical protein
MSIESILVDFRNVDMGALRVWLARLNGSLSTLTLGGVPTVIKQTRALLNDDLAHAADSIAIVYGDPVTANNDLYLKSGASGAGSWTLIGVLQGVAADAAASRDSAGASAVAAAGSATDADAAAAAAAASALVSQNANGTAIAASAASVAASDVALGASSAAQTALASVLDAIADGINGQFDTYADALAVIGSIAADALIIVRKDENNANHRTQYQKVGSSLVFKFDFQAQEVGLRRATARGRARCGFIFDDGYISNLTVAAPIFAKYGFAATVVPEVSRMGYLYNGSALHKVIDGADARALIALGWEIGNHPFLDVNATEAVMVSTARYENQLLRDNLTGAKVRAAPANAWPGVNAAGTHTTATATHPEFATYPVRVAVYQGGIRNDLSDRAYRAVPYNIIRSIAGTEAQAGRVQNNANDEGPFGIHWYPGQLADTNNDPVVLEQGKSYLRTLAASGADGLMYAHDTPATVPTSGFIPPFIHAAHLEELLAYAASIGVQIVPMSALGPGNMLNDAAFTEGTTGAVLTASASWNSVTTLNGSPRSVRVNGTSFSGNLAVHSASTQQFRVRPFTWYRFRLRLNIPSNLTLQTPGAANQGVAIRFSTTRDTAGGGGDMSIEDSTIRLWTEPGYARPNLATSGFQEFEFEWFSGSGSVGRVTIGLLQAQGEFFIGGWSNERLDSLQRRPVRGRAFFNGTVARVIDLVGPHSSWAWNFEVEPTPLLHRDFLTPNLTTTFAASDPAAISGATNGNTCYVLGIGAGAFAGQGGMIATFTGGSWSAFATVEATTTAASGRHTIIRAGTAEGLTNRTYLHLGRSGGVGFFVRHPESLTVNFAATDPSEISSPSTGNTVYVLGRGTGAFAGQGGKLATWSGSAWGSFASVPDLTIIKANTAEGFANRYYMHYSASGGAGQFQRCQGVGAFDEPIHVSPAGFGGFQRQVRNTSGLRTDAFEWFARPRILESTP